MIRQVGAVTKRFFIILFALIILIAGSWVWLKIEGPYIFPVKIVKINGANKVDQQQDIKQALLPMVTEGFLAVNVNAIKQRLLTLPWIAQAEVKRIWPDTLIIGIKQQVAVARWNDQQFVNQDGKVFSAITNEDASQLPQLFGPDGLSPIALERLQQFDQILKPLGLSVLTMKLTARRAWNIKLNNGMILYLGRVNIVARLQKFENVYPRVFANHEQQVDYVDLRYTNGFAVRWKNGSAPTLQSNNSVV